MRVVLFTLFILLTACGSSSPSPETSSSFAVLSWNISGDAFASHPHEFRALLAYAAPDIVLLDEVDPKTTAAQLLAALPPRKSASHRDTANNPWHISFGTSGGRQRDVIASREPLEELQEFAEVVPYPDDARRQIMQRMSATDQIRWGPSMDSGIAVNGAIDFQIYGPNALRVARGTVLDTEDLTANPMETHGLKPDWSIKLSNHRPLVVQYLWR